MSNREEFGAALTQYADECWQDGHEDVQDDDSYLKADARARVMALWDEREAMLKKCEEDAKRLDWLMLCISGAELRRLNVITIANCDREAIDAARQAQEGEKG